MLIMSLFYLISCLLGEFFIIILLGILFKKIFRKDTPMKRLVQLIIFPSVVITYLYIFYVPVVYFNRYSGTVPEPEILAKYAYMTNTNIILTLFPWIIVGIFIFRKIYLYIKHGNQNKNY